MTRQRPFGIVAHPAQSIALTYLSLSTVWILASDRVLVLVLPGVSDLTPFQTLKGWFFVAVTTALLYSLTDRWVTAVELVQYEERTVTAALQRYRLLATHTADIVLFMKAGGLIAEANQAALSAYGYSEAEMTQLRLSGLRVASEQHEANERLSEATRASVVFEATHQRRDGRTFPVEVSLAATEVEGELVWLGLIRDISRRRRNDDIRQLQTDVDRQILQDRPLPEVQAYLCERFLQLFDCTTVWFGLKQPDGTVRVEASAGGFPLPAHQMRWDDSLNILGPTAVTLQTGKASAGTYRDLPRATGEWRDLPEQYGLAAYLVLPLTVNGTTLGNLSLYSRRADAFDPQTVQVLETFANQIALSLMAARDREQARIQQAALESTPNAVVIVDRHERILWVNSAFERLTGYAASEMVGSEARTLDSHLDRLPLRERIWSTVKQGLTWRGEIAGRRKDGSTYPEEISVTPLQNAAGEFSHYIIIKQDVTDRKQHEAQLEYLATHDALTDLPNRRVLEECFQAARKAALEGSPSVLMLMDLDHFKVINDTQGHAVGDQLLVQLGRLLVETVPAGEVIARMGGDEFAVLVAEMGLVEGRAIAERIRQAVERFTFVAGSARFDLTVSIGIVAVDGSADYAAALALADATLYTAKGAGKNRVCACQTEADGEMPVSSSARWALRIKDALHAGDFVLHFQPVQRLAGGITDHYEALLRLTGEDGHPIGPDRFLPAAESFGLMPLIDRWVGDQVLSLLKADPKLHLFMNVSGQSLSDESLLAYLEAQIKASPEVAGRLIIEITESVAVRDIHRAQEWMRRLMECHCEFALDDFGTGFSSFAYLRSLPAKYVKIDGAFIRNMDVDPTNRLLVQSMSSVVHALGKEVVAEWVESPAIADICRELGLEYGQGFGLGVPGPLRSS